MRIFLLLTMISLHLHDGYAQPANVEKLKVFSSSMNKNIPVLIVTPASYFSDGKAYPVCYLLHGYSGDYQGYYNYMKDLPDLAGKFNMILVCPDGGFGSWYFDSPQDPAYQYETHIAKELTSWVDSNYRTIAQPKARAVAGLSMGGHGALYLAIRHPDIFGAAGSMSGGLDIRPFPNEWEIKKRLGDIRHNPERWEQNTVINMTRQIPPGMPLIIDCGVDDFFIEVNRATHRKLVAEKINHEYIERPGGHDWNYWKAATPVQLAFFRTCFTAAGY